MKKPFIALLMYCLAPATPVQSADQMFYELRIYHCYPGRLPALEERFRNHTRAIFEKHGMTNVGYWEPVENSGNDMYYILAYPSQEFIEQTWKNFTSDPQWMEVKRNSELTGKIVEKVTSIYMNPVDVQDLSKKKQTANPRVFQLSVSGSPNGSASDGSAKQKSGKRSSKLIGVWQVVNTTGTEPRMISIVAANSNKSFSQTQQKALGNTSDNPGGFLVDNNFSILLNPLDFSPIR